MLKDIEDLRKYSKKLEGKKISDIASPDSLHALHKHWNKVQTGEIKYMNKATINDIIENNYFKVPRNSSELPDIILKNGEYVELKVSHLFKSRDLIRPKYRLVLKVLNYIDMAENAYWWESALYKKLKSMLIVFYYKDEEKPPWEWTIINAFLWSGLDYKDRIQQDYALTRNRILEGNKISESDTTFLANCPKHGSKFCWWCHIDIECTNPKKPNPPPHPVEQGALRPHPKLGKAEKRGYCIPAQRMALIFCKEMNLPLERKSTSYGINIEKIPYLDPKLHM
jgi:hypothetical protein